MMKYIVIPITFSVLGVLYILIKCSYTSPTPYRDFELDVTSEEMELIDHYLMWDSYYHIYFDAEDFLSAFQCKQCSEDILAKLRSLENKTLNTAK